jgi:hypothetical protein
MEKVAMNKSIESVWQNGFIDDMALIAPKVNDLYDMKSQNLIDKFEYMFVANQRAVLIGAAVICLALSFFGAPILGGIITLMLCGLVYVGQRQLKELQRIDKTDSSLKYLVAFDTWLDNAIATYSTIYRFFYPTLFLLCAIRFIHSGWGEAMLTELSLVNEQGHTSVITYAIIALFTVVLGFAGGAIYRADVGIVYGREISKLKEMITEMKSLRN